MNFILQFNFFILSKNSFFLINKISSSSSSSSFSSLCKVTIGFLLVRKEYSLSLIWASDLLSGIEALIPAPTLDLEDMLSVDFCFSLLSKSFSRRARISFSEEDKEVDEFEEDGENGNKRFFSFFRFLAFLIFLTTFTILSTSRQFKLILQLHGPLQL